MLTKFEWIDKYLFDPHKNLHKWAKIKWHHGSMCYWTVCAGGNILLFNLSCEFCQLTTTNMFLKVLIHISHCGLCFTQWWTLVIQVFYFWLICCCFFFKLFMLKVMVCLFLHNVSYNFVNVVWFSLSHLWSSHWVPMSPPVYSRAGHVPPFSDSLLSRDCHLLLPPTWWVPVGSADLWHSSLPLL